jgi:Skp family chaperone for outer membrane proteins
MILSLLLTAGAHAADVRIACIDMGKVFDAYYKTNTAQMKLHQTRETYRQHALEQQKLIELDQKRFEALLDESQKISLSEEARNAKREEARRLENKIRQDRRDAIEYNQAKAKDLMDNYMKERNDILAEINKWIKSYSESNNYDLVIDISGNNSNNNPTVIYYNPALDISGVTISSLNKGHEAEIDAAKKAIADLKAAAGVSETSDTPAAPWGARRLAEPLRTWVEHCSPKRVNLRTGSDDGREDSRWHVTVDRPLEIEA